MNAISKIQPSHDAGKPKPLPLNEGQKTAKLEILKNMKPKRNHLLTGNAGSGKSYLMEDVARAVLERKKSVVFTAPTHKAVAVGAKRMAAAGLAVPCLTTYSLLSLEPHHGDDGRLFFKRRKFASPVTQDVIIIDETSMVGNSLYEHIKMHLYQCYVIHVGDPAQLNPVGEERSPTLDLNGRSHLSEVVRQEANNPVLRVATTIRDMQKKTKDDFNWEWCRSAKLDGKGVFLPGNNLEGWMRKAFESPEFKEDNDAFRYICYTNAKVAAVNAKVRFWRFGETKTPFSPTEKILFRGPIVKDDTIVFHTNEEALVEGIKQGSYTHLFRSGFGVEEWSVTIPTWEIDVVKDDGTNHRVHMPRDSDLVTETMDRLAMEARIDRDRWSERFAFQNSLAKVQANYALTAHNSQGSTFGHAFLDVRDIARRRRDNHDEMLRLLYVGASRPREMLFLVGV